MPTLLLLGAGKIGSLIATFLAETNDYRVHLADVEPQATNRGAAQERPEIVPVVLDANDVRGLEQYVLTQKPEAVISSLPYFSNPTVAAVARKHGLHYFDLTEDVEVTEHIERISRSSRKAFVPQCGLAPGFISIVTNEVMQHFDTLETVKMRVGALPVHPSNALKYSLTWSTDGLINEYGNVCYGIENGVKTALRPLEGYETIEVDGLLYEAFNTSGGLGTLADTYAGKVQTMNYKTLRYPGHCDKIHFLMNDLKLNQQRETLKHLLEERRSQNRSGRGPDLRFRGGEKKRKVNGGELRQEDLPANHCGKPVVSHPGDHGPPACAAWWIWSSPIRLTTKGSFSKRRFRSQAVLSNRFGQVYA